MKLENYLSDLLYRYECVIIPNFGAFVTNEISAIIDSDSNTMYPPKKELSFNSYLKSNDGLLANHIAAVEQISYTEALLKMNTSINEWKQILDSSKLNIDKIGSLHRDTNKNIIFEPNTSENYLTASFGLSSVAANTITKQIPVIEHSKAKKEISPLLRYAASAAIILTIGGSTGWNLYSKELYKQQLVQEKVQQDILEEKIQQATFTIENSLPAISLKTIVEEENSDSYFIIAGAYRDADNAEKKINQLLAKGYYDAKIIGKNKWGLTQVAYASFSDNDVARKQLKLIKYTDNKKAWLLVK